MSLAASNGILRTDTFGGGEPATLLWSEPSRAYHRGGGGPGQTDPTMCIRNVHNVRAGAEQPTSDNKRPAYDTTDDQQQALLYRQHRAPVEDADYDGGRESKLRRLTPPFPGEDHQQQGGGAPSSWASQQHPPQQQHYQQQEQLMEDAEPLAGGAQQENPRLKRNKPVKWSAEEDRRLREAVVRVSGSVVLHGIPPKKMLLSWAECPATPEVQNIPCGCPTLF